MLRAARALAGLTAGQLAKLAEIDASTISRLEGARRNEVGGQAMTVDRVVGALLKKGVQITDDGVFFVRKPHR
jgi:transcriptional regulator with XRE-family HTH domain